MEMYDNGVWLHETSLFLFEGQFYICMSALPFG